MVHDLLYRAQYLLRTIELLSMKDKLIINLSLIIPVPMGTTTIEGCDQNVTQVVFPVKGLYSQIDYYESFLILLSWITTE